MLLQVRNTTLARLLKCDELYSIWFPRKPATNPSSYSLYIIVVTIYSSVLVVFDSVFSRTKTNSGSFLNLLVNR